MEKKILLDTEKNGWMWYHIRGLWIWKWSNQSLFDSTDDRHPASLKITWALLVEKMVLEIPPNLHEQKIRDFPLPILPFWWWDFLKSGFVCGCHKWTEGENAGPSWLSAFCCVFVFACFFGKQTVSRGGILT